MATQTQSRTARLTRQRAATTRGGRSARTTRQQPSSARWSMPARTRKQPKKSGLSKALSSVGGALPGGAKGAKKTRAGGKGKGKAGGVALATAAAGLAFKNREKLMSAVGRRRGSQPAAPPVQHP